MSDELNCREDGCEAPSQLVDPETGWCQAHGPDGSKTMAERGYEGGKKPKYPNLSDIPEPQSFADIRKILGKAVTAVATGEMKPKVANAISRLARAWKDSREGELTEDQLAELRDRVQELQERDLEEPRRPWEAA